MRRCDTAVATLALVENPNGYAIRRAGRQRQAARGQVALLLTDIETTEPMIHLCAELVCPRGSCDFAQDDGGGADALDRWRWQSPWRTAITRVSPAPQPPPAPGPAHATCPPISPPRCAAAAPSPSFP